jgi:hypothetical protein
VRRAGALALAAVAPLGLAACQSTADKSARIAREGRQAVKAAGRLRVDRPNADVRAVRAVVVRGTGGAAAAAVELRNRGARAQADVPVLIDVRDAKGASVYRNDTVGLQPALQRLALVRGRGSAWWVNDQVLSASPPRTVTARVGAARTVARTADVALRDIHFESDATGRFLTGIATNKSRAVVRDVPVFGVALRGRRVVAAGRALLTRLVPAATAKKPFRFRLFFVGDPRGARVVLTVAPPAL